MSRLIPNSFFKEHNIIKREEVAIKKDNYSKQETHKRTPQQVAIERSTQRENALNKFCTKYNVGYSSNLCKYIKSIFRNPSTKNIPINEYKKELDIIGEYIKVNGIEKISNIVGNNASKGYKYLIYENQLEKTRPNVNPKDNISTETQKITKNVNLNDFEGYRIYLKNPKDDTELICFIRENLGVSI